MTKIMQKYMALQRRRAIRMLNALIKKIESGEFVVEDFGFWDARLLNKIIFRVTVISRDSEKEMKKLERFQ